MAQIIGRAVIYGIQPMRPIINLPTDANRIKIRMRADDICQAFIRYDNRIERWLVVPTNNTVNSPEWMIDCLQGVNYCKRLDVA